MLGVDVVVCMTAQARTSAECGGRLPPATVVVLSGRGSAHAAPAASRLGRDRHQHRAQESDRSRGDRPTHAPVGGSRWPPDHTYNRRRGRHPLPRAKSRFACGRRAWRKATSTTTTPPRGTSSGWFRPESRVVRARRHMIVHGRRRQ
jgi:hypothetical protein